MRKFLDKIFKNQSVIYKSLLYVASACLIVFFFPKGGQFKYEFQKGRPWQYQNLYAPFDFSINKGQAEVLKEQQRIQDEKLDYYSYDNSVPIEVRANFDERFPVIFSTDNYNRGQLNTLKQAALEILDELYEFGVVRTKAKGSTFKDIYLVKNQEANRIEYTKLRSIDLLENSINAFLKRRGLSGYANGFQRLFSGLIKPNVSFDKALTEKALESELSKISHTRGTISEGELVIAKGAVVEAEDLNILNSLKKEFESELWANDNFYYILSGYTVLVALVLMMLLLFLKKYRREIYEDNTKVTFIFFNVVLMVFVTTLVVQYNEAYIFVVPLCILPLIIKTFFDARLALFVHVLAVLILGFVVPNSYEYIFLQIIAGIVTILTVEQLYKRANLFISVGQITLIYMVGYLAFHTIHEGNLNNIEWVTLGLFLLNGMITLFVQPLIYIYERIFGLVSDVSLLELSDTNTKLLKELSNKAPGTFHHSLQVSNLAEAAANEIGANAMLVRVGALYHDIGKMENPTFYTENQITNVNPHDEISPRESAKIIIDHVIKGIELARKNNLPDRVIDFIRSHHGNTTVYYFFKKEQESGRPANEDDFKYPGPIPFSKETAILMMADSVEAASKSLKNPTFTIIDEFIDKIIDGQMSASQFLNANITFREIETVKKVLKQKLTNIYHLRVEYPE